MGVSADPVDRQRQFHEAHSLGFRLLSDPGGRVAKLFGVRRPGRLPPRRATFVIGGDGSVLRVIRSETNMHAHGDKALEALREAAART